MNEVVARRARARKELETALYGSDLNLIKSKHIALQATELESQNARIYVAGKLRKNFHLQFLQNLVDYSEHKTNPRQFESNIMELVDQLIEVAAGVN